jgi:hypothetical protein
MTYQGTANARTTRVTHLKAIATPQALHKSWFDGDETPSDRPLIYCLFIQYIDEPMAQGQGEISYDKQEAWRGEQLVRRLSFARHTTRQVSLSPGIQASMSPSLPDQ